MTDADQHDRLDHHHHGVHYNARGGWLPPG